MKDNKKYKKELLESMNSQLSALNSQLEKGFTLVEMLVVIFVFSVLAILATQSIALTLRGSRKSEAMGEVRQNVEYAMNVMERSLRSAKKLDCSGLPSDNKLDYIDEEGNSMSFECVMDDPTYGHMESNSQRLTNSEVGVKNCMSVFNKCCTFTDTTNCPLWEEGIPDSVDIQIVAEAVNASGAEGAQITSSTKILLRNY